VLERAHFSVYNEIYAGTARTIGLGPPFDADDVRIFSLSGTQATEACPP
jgi:hypothetical protein